MHEYALLIGWPVPILKKVMSSADITEAMAYLSKNPHGEHRADLRAGIIASVIANVNRNKNTKAYKPEDFMPDFTGRRQKTLKDKIKEVFGIGDTR